MGERVEAPRSPYTLFAGTILPCVMTQGIDSDLPGQIGCMISQNVFDTVTGHYLLVPQGTKAIGTYDSRIAYGQSRVLVMWTRAPPAGWLDALARGHAGDGSVRGMQDSPGHVNNHYVRLLSGVVLGSLIGASAEIADRRQQSETRASPPWPLKVPARISTRPASKSPARI